MQIQLLEREKEGEVMMNYNNINAYYSSFLILKEMLDLGLITVEEAIKSESLLASHNCIEKDSVYRLIDLIKDENRAMYSARKKV